MRSYVAAVCLAGSLLLGLQPATAETIRSNIVYNVFGTCSSNCPAVGLNYQDSVIGTLVLSTEEINELGPFDNSNLVSFSVTFGANTITNRNAVGTSLSGLWGEDANIVGITLRASTATAPNAGLGLVLGSGPGIVSTAANCSDASCKSLNWTSAALLDGVRFLEVERPAPVPLPPALLLAVAGPCALVLAARRRRRPAR